MRKILTSFVLSATLVLSPLSIVVQAQEIPLLNIMQRPADISCAELERRTDLRSMSDRDRQIYVRNYERYAGGIEAAKTACGEARLNQQLDGEYWQMANRPESVPCEALKRRAETFPMSAEDAAFFAKLSPKKTDAIRTALEKCVAAAADSSKQAIEQTDIFPTMLANPTLVQCEQLEKGLNILKMSELQRKRYAELDVKKIELLQQALQECDKNKITAEPTFLSYKTVRDNFGKRIGDSFVVIQINIRNESPTSQFFVQDIAVLLDPNQCQKAAEFYNEVGVVMPRKENRSIKAGQNGQSQNEESDQEDETLPIDPLVAEQLTAARADRAKSANDRLAQCLTYFNEQFAYPTQFSPVARDTVLGVATANLNRSPRNIFFRGLRFAADMGGVLTGLSLLGPDGVKGFNFLGTSVYNSADTALPSISQAKMENLRRTLPEGNVVVSSREAKIYNIFIPTDRFFSKTTWEMYKKKTNKMDDEALKLRRMIELMLVSSVRGVMISSESPSVTLKPGGGANELRESFKKP